MIRRDVLGGVHVRAASQAREADVIASTADLDAYGERVAVEGLDLARYKANPVVLYGHDAQGLPIGYAADVRVDGGKLHARVRFVDERANPKAEQVYQAVRQGALRGVSIGFVARERKGEVITRSELMEISLVPLPANPAAVVTAVRSHQEKPKMEKQYHQLTLAERHALAVSDRDAFDRLRAAPVTWKGRTLAELTNDDLRALYREDPSTFNAMLAAGRTA